MASDLATAYVQILPSAAGIGSKLRKELGGETEGIGEAVGSSIGSSIGSFIVKTIAALGIGQAIADSIMSGADLEQSIGGIETLFKDSSDTMLQYAQDAYKTAGLSANEYMTQSTSFAASLLQSLNGDTAKAADAANSAIVDMADNANKMGTSMDLIQNAYQGFAKQNYTMLDNLKLGYGGTQAEMERLLQDASALTGVEYDISNLSDVYSAIHAIQDELGITGTTAAEASETISGSMAAVKAAWDNLLADLALGNDISKDIDALSETVITAANNLLPAIENIIGRAPEMIIKLLQELGPPLIDAVMQTIASIADGIGEGLPQLIDTGLDVLFSIVDSIINNLDTIVSAGLTLVVGLVTGILDALPILISNVPVIVQTIITTLLSLIPEVIEAGLNLITSLVTNLPQIISDIVAIIPTVIDALINTILTLVPMIIDTGVELLSALVANLPDIISAIIEVLPVIINAVIDIIIELLPLIEDTGYQLFTSLMTLLPEILTSLCNSVMAIVDGIINAFLSVKGKFVEVGPKLTGYIRDSFQQSAVGQIGKQLVDGLWLGIKNTWTSLTSNIKKLCGDLLTTIKNTFGIHSPSVVFRDEVGKMLDLGLAEGITGNSDIVTGAASELKKSTMGVIDDTQVSINSSVNTQVAYSSRVIVDQLGYIIDFLNRYLPELANAQIIMDSGALVGELAPGMDAELGRRSARYTRGVY